MQKQPGKSKISEFDLSILIPWLVSFLYGFYHILGIRVPFGLLTIILQSRSLRHALLGPSYKESTSNESIVHH